MEEREQEALRELGAARVGEIHCITIIGQVEGHVMLPPDTKTTKYEHIMPLLAAVEETEDIRALLILLNTVGGDIEAGLCLAEMIAGMSKPTASVVLGGGHSIGVPLAVAADRSFIVPSAAVTIHPVRLTGVVIGVPQTYDYISRISDRVRPVHHRPFPHHAREIHRVYDAHRRADAGHRQRARRRGSRPKRAHRPARWAFRRA